MQRRYVLFRMAVKTDKRLLRAVLMIPDRALFFDRRSIMTKFKAAIALSSLLYASPGAYAASTTYPLKISNCGQELVFTAAPKSVAAVGQSTTEMLYALGLGNKVVGTSVWFNEVLPDYKEVNAKVPRLADNHPGFEAVAAKKPDLVTTQFEVHVGSQGVVGTRQQFNELGINVYAMPADCVGKDNLSGGDGSRKTPFSIDTVYRAVDELSTIFDVQDRGDKLEEQLRSRVASAAAKAKALDLKDVSAVFWFSSADIELDPFVAGQKGIPGFIMNTLGVKNVVESDEEYPSVGWETIAKANPDVIIIARMDRRRYPADDYQVKLDYLKSDPVTREMKAVKQGRIVVVDAHAVHAGIRIPAGIEAVADALEDIKGQR